MHLHNEVCSATDKASMRCLHTSTGADLMKWHGMQHNPKHVHTEFSL